MGAVHKETPGQNINYHEYESVSLSDPKCLRALIKFKSEIYPDDKDQNHFSELMTVIYVDLENLINETILTRRERYVIDRMMDGWTEGDCGLILGLPYITVHRLFLRACVKMAKTNYQNSLRIIKKNMKC